MANIVFVNLITTIRVIGIIFLYPVYINYGGSSAALLAFFCYLSDALDGYLARRLYASTFFGSLYDTLADKALNLISFIILFDITYLVVIPLIFEILIIIINILRYSANQNVRVKLIGRIKMIILSLTVVLAFLLSDIYNFESIHSFAYLFSILIIFEIIAFGSYLKHFVINDKNFKGKSKLTVDKKWFDNEYFEKNKDGSYKNLD